ncbi:PREDICTED: uncharacterized protein LOC109205292 isoform X2 [Nicotiana attenuata]|uniref:uncharacterized protein LOC109205292 isoform X2 n=1 Tax=Nicotiana attenuata TaxID=49451 RepID=UPI0009051335|nr:PREDICTED: uncharacterized protein LOC109205292 isoform X2 [Nicotiana attenuata]
MSNLPINYAKYPYLPLKLGCSFRQTTRTVLSLTSDSNARVRPTKRKDLIKMAAIYSLYIINKSGGLIFYKDYGSAGRMDTNDTLRLASLWHSMHAISQQLSPIPGCSGIELLQADTFDLNCFQSLTGNFQLEYSEKLDVWCWRLDKDGQLEPKPFCELVMGGLVLLGTLVLV